MQLDCRYIKDMEVISPDDGSSFGTRTVIGSPTWFSETPVAETPGQAPGLAEHTEEVLQALGFSQEVVAGLLAEGVVDGSDTGRRGDQSSKL